MYGRVGRNNVESIQIPGHDKYMVALGMMYPLNRFREEIRIRKKRIKESKKPDEAANLGEVIKAYTTLANELAKGIFGLLSEAETGLEDFLNKDSGKNS